MLLLISIFGNFISEHCIAKICVSPWRSGSLFLLGTMNTLIIDSENCENMADVRAGVDAVDQELVALLAKRFGYMDAAARIKNDRNAVRDEARKSEVLNNVAVLAAAHNIPEALIQGIWETLVEGSIAYELARWDRTKA